MRLRSPTIAALVCLLAGAAQAQARWIVDPVYSLGWWQVNPHLNHLWATTCPEEPSWRPGDGRSGGWGVGRSQKPKHGYAAVSDTTLVPLYPRFEALPICGQHVSGYVVIPDTVRWRGVSGEVTVEAAALRTGSDQIDAYTRSAILEANRHQTVRFRIDSLTDVTRAADTLWAFADGVFTLRETSKPVRASIRAWPEVGGLRVFAKFRVEASDLVTEYGLSRFALGLGVATSIWHHLYMGVDVILRPEGEPAGR